MPRIRRFFQPQLPQALRPALSSILSRTIGKLNLESPTVGLTAIAYWTRFSRWCNQHSAAAHQTKNGSGREWLYRSVIERERLGHEPITYLEFGVYRGASLQTWLGEIAHSHSRFVGFDTFTGLPERWRPTEPQGHFNADGLIPDVKDERCSFEVGLFQDTLPAFVKRTDLSGRLVINLDADMFTSTFFVLASLAPHLKAGDILFFDEFSCPLDEFRAFDDFVKSFRMKYEVLGAVYGYTQVCVRIAS